ncbi:MAG: capsule assembly Wzi family protein, partial [Candidatus Poribacteria bacterium]
ADLEYPGEAKSDANSGLSALGRRTDEYLLQTRGETYQFGVSLESGGIYNTVSGGIDVRDCPSGASAGNWEGTCRNLTKERQSGYITLLRPTVLGQIKDSFAFYSDLKFYILTGDRFPDIPKAEGVRYQSGADFYTAALTTSYGKFKLPWFELLLGRGNLSWGPGRHGALLISDNPLPMDMMKLSAWYKWIKFHAFTSILGGDISKKYLSGHRLEFNLWDRVSLGIAETMVYAGRFDITFLNPLQIYTVTGMLPKSVEGESIVSPDNGLDSADIDILLLKNLEFYGELMIDDFQPEFGLRSPFHWASKWGILLGFYYIDPFSLPDTDVRVEYAFVNQYAYTHDPMDTTYTHYYFVIGHHIGADADDLFIDVRHRFTDKLQMALSYELERHGEGNVNKPHPQDAPWEEEWEFLSGVTESTNSLSLGLSYAVVGRYFADVKYTASWVKNVSNKLGENSTRHQFILNGSYRF